MQLLATFLVGFFFTSFDLYSATSGWTPPPSMFMAALYCTVLALYVSRFNHLSSLLKSRVALWTFLFVVISLAWSFFADSSEKSMQLLIDRIQGGAFLFACATALFPAESALAARRTMVVAALLGVALNLIDMVLPMTFSTVFGRSAGLYGNPNISGTALVFGAALGTGALPHRFRAPFLAVVTLGVVTTLSRSAMLGIALVWTVLWFHREASLRATVGALAGTLLAGVLLAGGPSRVLRYLEAVDVLNAGALGRLQISTSDDSAEDRETLAREALSLIADSPVLGHGTGGALSTRPDFSTHNMALNLWVDHGLIGLALFLALPFAIWSKTPHGRAFVGAYLVASMFSHNLLEERYALLCLGLVAAEAHREHLLLMSRITLEPGRT